MNTSPVAISGIALIPLIIGLIQYIKRFFPNAPYNAWLATSMLLAVIGQTVIHLAVVGTPASLSDWSGLVVISLSFGLTTSKVYDEYEDRTNRKL